ncbi:hypothetical protein CYMTET_43066 [Cymbomonas tetramitiformis]|uniref:Uncharacterized protein n=1 Tax=Cymbomonas tetramitiformis TaxID=36881 RepID=A0AAE0C2Y7_9CHLO|nr:hypothetical protein CYMTET_43066 [Cymbomonas tetramitiformis]
MQESATLRNLGLSANVIPKAFKSIYRAIIGGDSPDSGDRAGWMSSSQVKNWTLVIAEFKTQGLADLLDMKSCPIPDHWKEVLGPTLAFSILFDTSMRYTKHLMPIRLGFFDFRPEEYKPITPLLEIGQVPDTSGDTQAAKVLQSLDKRVHVLQGWLQKRPRDKYPHIDQGLSRGGCGAHIEHIKYTAFQDAVCGELPKDSWDEIHVVNFLNKLWWFHHSKTWGQWNMLSFLYTWVFGITLVAFGRCIATRWEYDIKAMANFDNNAAQIRICLFLYMLQCCFLRKPWNKHLVLAYKWSASRKLRLQMKVMLITGEQRYSHSLNWLKGQDKEPRITLPSGERACLPPGHRFHEMPSKTLEWQRQIISDISAMEDNLRLFRNTPFVLQNTLECYRAVFAEMVRRVFGNKDSKTSTVLVVNSAGRRPYFMQVSKTPGTWEWPAGHPVIQGDGRVWDPQFEDMDYDPASFDCSLLTGEPPAALRDMRRGVPESEELQPVPNFGGIYGHVLKLAWLVLGPAHFNDLFDGIMSGCRLSLQRHIKWYEEWQHLPHSMGQILLAESCGPTFARAFLNVFFVNRVGPPTLEASLTDTWMVVNEIREKRYVPSAQQAVFEHFLQADVDKAGRLPWEHFVWSTPPNTFRLLELMSSCIALLQEVVLYAYPSSEEDMVVGPLLEKWACMFIFNHYVLTQQIEGDFNRIDNTGHRLASVDTISAVNVGYGVNSIEIAPNADGVKAARKVVREKKVKRKLETDAMHLREVEKHIDQVKVKRLAVIEKARKLEAAEVARTVKELCSACTQTKKRIVNQECGQEGGPCCATCCKVAGGCDKYVSHMPTVPRAPDTEAAGYMPQEEVLCAEVYDFLGMDLLDPENCVTADDMDTPEQESSEPVARVLPMARMCMTCSVVKSHQPDSENAPTGATRRSEPRRKATAQPRTATAQPETATAQPETATAHPETATEQPQTDSHMQDDQGDPVSMQSSPNISLGKHLPRVSPNTLRVSERSPSAENDLDESRRRRLKYQ